MLQYSKFNNPEGIVRDVTSVAQALCVEDIEAGYFDHTTVNVYIAAKFVLPVVASVASLTIISNYYPILMEKVTNPKDRPTFVGVTMAGTYLTLYMIAVDISAIVFYVDNKTEYRFYSSISNSRNLQLTYYTFITECALSTMALLIATILHPCVGKNSKSMADYKSICLIILFIFFFTYVSTMAFVIVFQNKIIILLLTAVFLLILIITIAIVFSNCTRPTNYFLIGFIIVPIIFGSSHVDYILVAWLTEPAKTTSVAILAIAIVFYLFFLSQFLYKLISKIISKIKPDYWKRDLIKAASDNSVENTFSPSWECCKLSVIFLLGLCGVGLASLQIAAFYLLPFPSIRLVDYLDNIFQVSVVIFGGLITYKLISGQESDKDKQVEKSDKTKLKDDDHKQVSKVVKETDPEPVEITATLTVVVKNKVVMNNTKSQPKTEFQEQVLELEFNKGHKKTEIVISDVEMNHEWSNNGSQWHCSLESSKIQFNLFSNRCIISLRDSLFHINNAALKSGKASDLELFVIHNTPNPLMTIVKKSSNDLCCETIPLTENRKISLEIPVESYLINKPFFGLDKGAVCKFSDSITLVRWNNHLTTLNVSRLLLPIKNGCLVSISRTNDESQLSIGNDYTSAVTFGNKVTITRHSTAVSLKCSIQVNNFLIKIKKDEESVHLILQHQTNGFNIKVPLDHIQSGTSTIALTVGQQFRIHNPSIVFNGQCVYSVVHTNKTFFFERNDNEVIIRLSDTNRCVITSTFQYLQVTNAETAAIIITSPIPTDVNLRQDQTGLVNLTWETDNKTTTIKYLERPSCNLMLELNNMAVNSPAILYIPTINEKKFDRAKKSCKNSVVNLVPQRRQSLPILP